MKETQTILGQVPSKANTYRIMYHGKTPTLGKTDAMRAYERSFFAQCNLYRNRNISTYFELELKVFYKTLSPDLDNSLKVILDCLQQCRAIKNDRYCMKITAEKFVDKTNPRIEFSLIPCQV